MSEIRNLLTPALKRGLLCGLIVGIILGILLELAGIRYWSTSFRSTILAMVLIAFGVTIYRYVGAPLVGLFSGIAAFFTQEIIRSLTFSSNPFYVLSRDARSMQYAFQSSEGILWFGLSVIGLPIAGFIGGYLCQRSGINRGFSSESTELTDLENKVLTYIQTHNNQIQITDCATDLGVDSNSIKKILKSLKKKGILQT